MAMCSSAVLSVENMILADPLNWMVNRRRTSFWNLRNKFYNEDFAPSYKSTDQHKLTTMYMIHNLPCFLEQNKVREAGMMLVY